MEADVRTHTFKHVLRRSVIGNLTFKASGLQDRSWVPGRSLTTNLIQLDFR